MCGYDDSLYEIQIECAIVFSPSTSHKTIGPHVQHGTVRLRDDELKPRVENQTVSDYGVKSVFVSFFFNPVAKITFKHVGFIN